MNKTLLLILCDFLLLTILSMWKMEEDAPVSESSGDVSDDVSVSAMAMMEQDLLDTLQYALEEEKDERSELAEDLNEKAENLERTLAELEAREERIQNLEQDMSAAAVRERELANEKLLLEQRTENLSNQIKEASESYTLVEKRLQETELDAEQSAAQSRLLQEELAKKLEEIQKKEAALEVASEKLAATEREVQELGVQVRMSAQENEFLQSSVTTLKGEITAERTERMKLQEQAGKLAEGVSQLAENSQDLRQEIRSSIPINANQLFSNYKANQIEATFRSLKYQRNKYLEDRDSVATILVTDGQRTFALYHMNSGPFNYDSNVSLIRSSTLTLSRLNTIEKANTIQFLALDPRILAIPVSAEQVAKLGGNVYYTALEPFKWEEAVLVNQKEGRYGSVEFKLDSETPGYVKMQTKILSSIFGEFSPSTGDLVFSKTGELLGVMVNNRYCVIIDNFLATQSIRLGDTLDAAAIEKALRQQSSLLTRFPSALR